MIEVKDLLFTYPKGTQPALQGLSFTVAPGEIFGFLGPSGAGKSTTQKILIGLLQGFTGEVAVLGKPLGTWKSDYYERIGVSFEFPNHYLKLTALENLRCFGALYDRPLMDQKKLLELVGLQDDGDIPVGQYSKGMKNRLSVARALLHNPDLLFLDEPTAGLDPVNARRVMDLIREQQQLGKTVFLTTHDMSVADELCERVAFIVAGQIPLIDRPAELKLKFGQPGLRVEFQQNGQVQSREFRLQGLGENQAFLDLLCGSTIRTIHTQEASLSDVFIRVTGQPLG